MAKNNLHEKALQLAARPYTVRILRDDSDSETLYLALNPELEGCMAQGETVTEAESNLDEVRVIYIEHLLEHNLPVPYPESMTTVTGDLTGIYATTLMFDASPISESGSNILREVIPPDDSEFVFEVAIKTSESILPKS